MNALFLVAVWVVFIGVMIYSSNASRRSVFGRELPDSETVPFLEQHLKDYTLNDITWKSGGKMLYGMGHLPFIAQTSKGMFGQRPQWYVNDYGMIPKNSKAEKMINDHWDTLPKPLEPKLSDL